jgi:hypothetical protein
MPAKISMLLSNGNPAPILQQRPLNTSSLGVVPAPRKPSSALNAPFIARVHNVRPGCGSCGRK